VLPISAAASFGEEPPFDDLAWLVDNPETGLRGARSFCYSSLSGYRTNQS